MADELLDLDLEEGQEGESKAEKRIKSLSEKVKATSQERDELAKAKEAEAAERAKAEKERDFYKGFSEVAGKYQGAAEYQGKIWEKVNSGYSIEDATTSTLISEGRFQPQAAPVNRESPAGGSASNTLKGGDQKSVRDMTPDEKRSALLEAEQKGELSLN